MSNSKHQQTGTSSNNPNHNIHQCGLHGDNYIGCLNEESQSLNIIQPEFTELMFEGLAHDRTFTITCRYKNRLARGRGKTLKAARQAAAKAWLDVFGQSELACRTIGFKHAYNVARKGWALTRAIAGYEDDQDSVQQVVSRIAMSVAQLALNVTPASISIFVIQLAIEFGYTLDKLLSSLQGLYESVSQCSSQLIQNIVAGFQHLLNPAVVMERRRVHHRGEVARRTALEFPEFTPQLIAGAAGALGGCAVLIAALITGVKDFSSQKGFLKHLAEFSSKISKFKGGMYALMDMVKHFHLFVKESVLGYLGEGTPSTIVRAIESMNLELDGKKLATDEFFDMVEKLNSVEGEAVMGVQPDALKQGKFALFVITKVLTQNMAETYAIPPSAIAALAETKRSLEMRVKSASVKHGAKDSKFEPFCIWLAGPSGAGKSTAVGFIQKWLRIALSKNPMKFELPSDDRFFFSANFTQEYHTGYNGQYTMAVDDICQDRAGLLKNSSLMFLIQSKSRVPSNVTQASLEDKLCPFDSKILICTSNVTHPNRDKEIVDQDALLRRRDMLIYAVKDETYPVDPILKRKILFSLLDPMKEANSITNPIKKYKDFTDMMTDILQRYVAHYDAQKALDGKVLQDDAATAFAESFWQEDVLQAAGGEEAGADEDDEIAQATMYRFPECLRPENLIRQCKFEASRMSAIASDCYRTHPWKILAGVSVIAAASFTAYKLLYKPSTQEGVDGSCWEVLKPYTTGESAELTYDRKTVRVKPVATPTYNKELVRARANAMAVRTTFVEAMQVKNVVKVSRAIDGRQGAQNGLFVKGRFLLTCRHFFTGMKDGEEFEITEYPQYSTPRISKHSFDESRMVRVPEAQDAVIYEAGHEVQSHKNIVPRFFQHDLPDRILAASVGVYPTASQVIGEAKVLTRKVEYYLSDEETAECVQVHGFEMFANTTPGRSGAPIVTDESTNRAPTIFGIQTSMMEGGSRAYFEALTRSQIEATLKQFEAENAKPSMDYDAEVPDDMKDMCKKSLIYVCPAERPVHQMQQTRLQRSPINPDYPVDETLTEFVPSAMRGHLDGVKVDVLKKSMAGFDRQYGCVNMKLADEVLREFSIEDKSVRKLKNVSARLLTKDEVMNGIPGRSLKGVETKTSPGLPLIHQKAPGKPGKETWISRGSDDERILCDEQWEVFHEHEQMIRDEEQPPYLAYACLKDELRPLDKVRALKTRSFIILPMIMNLLIRKYFGMWVMVQHELHNRISSSVGIDVNTEWTTLKRRLLTVGSSIEDFDYADWDRSLHAEWFRIYADRVSAWYGDRKGSAGWKARRTLMDILAHLPIQIGGHIVQTSGGNKSGCAITAEVNSDVHDMLMLYVWKRVCRAERKEDLASLPKFRENVALALYGDDVVKATSAATAQWFNGDKICAEVEKLGMKITPGNKIDTEFRIKKIEEVTFLKRRFLALDEDCGEVRAPLDKAVIQRMMLWVHASDDPYAACVANVKGALCEAFFWGEAFYRELMDRVEQAWSPMEAAEIALPFVDYKTLKYNWTNKVRCEDVPAQFQYSIAVGQENPEGDEIV